MLRDREFFTDPPQDLSGLPQMCLQPRTWLYRVHQKGYSPWWFGNSGKGRFDISAPRGTCYLGLDPLTALAEALGPFMIRKYVPASFLRERIMSKVQVPDDKKLADLNRAFSGYLHYGLTREIFSTHDYAKTQAWAQKIAIGFEGIRYQTRFTLQESASGIALFHDAGEADWSTAQQMFSLYSIAQEYGFTIVHPPYDVRTID